MPKSLHGKHLEKSFEAIQNGCHFLLSAEKTKPVKILISLAEKLCCDGIVVTTDWSFLVMNNDSQMPLDTKHLNCVMMFRMHLEMDVIFQDFKHEVI